MPVRVETQKLPTSHPLWQWLALLPLWRASMWEWVLPWRAPAGDPLRDVSPMSASWLRSHIIASYKQGDEP